MFLDRAEAGDLISGRIQSIEKWEKSVLVALPRGGVKVAESICRLLALPLAILPVKKISSPENAEFAIGAITENAVDINWESVKSSGISQEYIKNKTIKKRNEIRLFRKMIGADFDISMYPDSNLIIVDDGVATGETINAAIKQLKITNIHPIIYIAVPVIAKRIYNILLTRCDGIITLNIPDDFNSVGQYYKDFSPVDDEEVKKIYETYCRTGKSG